LSLFTFSIQTHRFSTIDKKAAKTRWLASWLFVIFCMSEKSKLIVAVAAAATLPHSLLQQPNKLTLSLLH
jgi:hypothetical protein